jgi:hypothetical protein
MGRDARTARVTLLGEHYRLGNPAHSDLELFGGWLDGVVTGDGSTVVSDRRMKVLLVSTPTGRASAFTRSGSGPGEIQDASALFPRFAGHFAILDNALFRLTLYSLQDGHASLVKSYATKSQPTHPCALDSAYVGLSMDPTTATILRTFTLGSDPGFSFGAPLIAGSWLLNRQASLGPILCTTDPPGIIFAPQTGELIAYSLAGKVRWRKVIPDFEPGLLKEVPSGVVSGLIPDGAPRSRLVARLVALSADVGLLQLNEYEREGLTPKGAPTFKRTLSKLFDIRTGTLLGEQDDLPNVLSATDRLLLVAHPDPEPWVQVVEYRLNRGMAKH